MLRLNFQRRLLRLVLAVTAHPVVTLLLCAAVLAGCIFLALTRLPVSTDQNKLFSAKAQFFHDWLDFNEKFPENEALYVVVEPNDPRHVDVGQWTGLVDRITKRLHRRGARCGEPGSRGSVGPSRAAV